MSADAITSARQTCLKKGRWPPTATPFLSRQPDWVWDTALTKPQAVQVFRVFLFKSLIPSIVHRYVQHLVGENRVPKSVH